MRNEQANDRMHSEHRVRSVKAKRQVSMQPAAIRPEGHESNDTEASWDWQSFEVCSFAGRILGYISCRDIKAR